ncbi:hypothetical protein N8334_06745 [Flavobacteriaceae bacterium]|nr:hypothetical protein [Flavobacteriaceae bacterium]
MKNIKEIVIGIFAVIGFAAIVTGFRNEAEQEHTVPESHVWEMHISDSDVFAFSINKQTGEVRKYETFYKYQKKAAFGQYNVASPSQ